MITLEITFAAHMVHGKNKTLCKSTVATKFSKKQTLTSLRDLHKYNSNAKGNIITKYPSRLAIVNDRYKKILQIFTEKGIVNNC